MENQEMARFEQENRLLKKKIKQLEAENKELTIANQQKDQIIQQQKGLTPKSSFFIGRTFLSYG